LKYLLHTHTQWYKLQMCEDNFNNLFQLSSLKKGTKEPIDDPILEEPLPFDDQTIVRVMEWTALTRSEAIALLNQYEGTVEQRMEEIFALLFS